MRCSVSHPEATPFPPVCLLSYCFRYVPDLDRETLTRSPISAPAPWSPRSKWSEWRSTGSSSSDCPSVRPLAVVGHTCDRKSDGAGQYTRSTDPHLGPSIAHKRHGTVHKKTCSEPIHQTFGLFRNTLLGRPCSKMVSRETHQLNKILEKWNWKISVICSVLTMLHHKQHFCSIHFVSMQSQIPSLSLWASLIHTDEHIIQWWGMVAHW